MATLYKLGEKGAKRQHAFVRFLTWPAASSSFPATMGCTSNGELKQTLPLSCFCQVYVVTATGKETKTNFKTFSFWDSVLFLSGNMSLFTFVDKRNFNRHLEGVVQQHWFLARTHRCPLSQVCTLLPSSQWFQEGSER